MPRSQSVVIADVRYHIDDENAGRYTDTKIRHWINEIARDIAAKSECLRATDGIAAIVDETDYATLTNTFRIHKVSYADADGYEHGDLDYVDIHNFNLQGNAFSRQAPRVFTTLGYPPDLSIRVHPAPDNLGDFTVHYYAIPTRLVETSNTDAAEDVEVPEGWIDTLVLGVEYKLLRADRDERWQEAKALYDENLGALIDGSTRYVDQGGQMGMVYNAGGGYGGMSSGWAW